MITVGMLIATAVVYYQYQFIKNYDRGYNVSSVLAVPRYNIKSETYQTLKAELLTHNNIQSIGAPLWFFQALFNPAYPIMPGAITAKSDR